MDKARDLVIGTIGAFDIMIGGYSMATNEIQFFAGWFFVFSGVAIVLLIWAPLVRRAGYRFISERALFAQRWPHIQKWVEWRNSRPFFGGVIARHIFEVKSGKVTVCSVSASMTILSNFYYGDTLIVANDIKLTIKQRKGGRNFFYNMKLNKSALASPVPLGPAQYDNIDLLFEWDGIGSEERFAPNLTFEYTWILEGAKAKLIGPAEEHEGDLPAVKGTELGRRG